MIIICSFVLHRPVSSKTGVGFGVNVCFVVAALEGVGDGVIVGVFVVVGDGVIVYVGVTVGPNK